MDFVSEIEKLSNLTIYLQMYCVSYIVPSIRSAIQHVAMIFVNLCFLNDFFQGLHISLIDG